jgi:DNA-binding transcriptional ArsR family regulator
MNPRIRRIAELDRVIHEPGRLMIVSLLYDVETAGFTDLAHNTQMNKGTLSSHISCLEEAGYVEVEKTYRGKIPQTLVTFTSAGRKAFERYRRKLKEVL